MLRSTAPSLPLLEQVARLGQGISERAGIIGGSSTTSREPINGVTRLCLHRVGVTSPRMQGLLKTRAPSTNLCGLPLSALEARTPAATMDMQHTNNSTRSCQIRTCTLAR